MALRVSNADIRGEGRASRETSEVKYVVRLKDHTRANVPWNLRSSRAGETNYLSEYV